MTTESGNIIQKSKKAKDKDKDFKNTEKKNFKDGGKVQKKTLNKQKKAKKDNDTLSEQVDVDDVDQALDESLDVDSKSKDVKKKPSKRQLKREKAAKREAEVKEKVKLEVIEKALNYVSKWKHARSQWKFEKVKQIWLINHLLSDTYIPDEHFPTVMEYFEGCKGQARKQLIDKAMEIIRKAEDNIEEDETVVETTEYKRARHLIQALPTET
ncbi:uncharacterized protein C7orf50 homolog [Copidosoma floridanum]|uniref:uncharacterized protein C7orf50 homolog n=1 Tax=Copidosoma floridanum TaxID=29053 RepID=UPI000C6F8FB0|nr:uncharacterized protein C7orf50 homolog [Copidosoma floridanum]